MYCFPCQEATTWPYKYILQGPHIETCYLRLSTVLLKCPKTSKYSFNLELLHDLLWKNYLFFKYKVKHSKLVRIAKVAYYSLVLFIPVGPNQSRSKNNWIIRIVKCLQTSCHVFLGYDYKYKTFCLDTNTSTFNYFSTIVCLK